MTIFSSRVIWTPTGSDFSIPCNSWFASCCSTHGSSSYLLLCPLLLPTRLSGMGSHWANKAPDRSAHRLYYLHAHMSHHALPSECAFKKGSCWTKWKTTGTVRCTSAPLRERIWWRARSPTAGAMVPYKREISIWLFWLSSRWNFWRRYSFDIQLYLAFNPCGTELCDDGGWSCPLKNCLMN